MFVQQDVAKLYIANSETDVVKVENKLNDIKLHISNNKTATVKVGNKAGYDPFWIIPSWKDPKCL